MLSEEQKNKRTFAYSGEYLKGKKAFQNRNTNAEFGILRNYIHPNKKAMHASNTDVIHNLAKIENHKKWGI